MARGARRAARLWTSAGWLRLTCNPVVLIARHELQALVLAVSGIALRPLICSTSSWTHPHPLLPPLLVGGSGH